MAKTYKKYCFDLPGVTCINCIYPIEKALQGAQKTGLNIKSFSADAETEKTEPDIESFSADIEKKLVVMVNDSLQPELVSEQIIKILDGIGVDCLYLPPAAEIEKKKAGKMEDKEEETTDVAPVVSNGNLVAATAVKTKSNSIRRYIIKAIIGISVGAALMGLMMSGIGIPMLAMYVIIFGASLLTLILGAESYKQAFKKFYKSKTLTMDTLFTLSTLTLVGVSIAHLFVPWLPMMPEAALLIFGFRDIGEALNGSIKTKLYTGLAFKERGAKKVKRKKINQFGEVIWEEVESLYLEKNDVIQVSRGETIPVDGVCENEETSIYKLNGSTLPKDMFKGERIYAGMKVPEDVDYIEMIVKLPVTQSNLYRMDAKVLAANAEKAPIQTITAKILQYFIPAVIVIAAISGIVIGSLVNPALGVQCAAAVFATFCPCTAGFVVPFAIKTGMSKGLEHGVQFRSGKSLQAANEVDVVVFDLNGTLTTGVPEVSKHYFNNNKITKKQFFTYLALLEKRSLNPIGKAIYEFAKEDADDLDDSKLNINVSHRGRRAIIDDEECLIGNIDYLAQNNITVKEMPAVAANEQVIFFVRGKEVVGYVKIKDPLRKDALFVVKELKAQGKNGLKRQGKEVHLCTGMDQEAAERYADELGIDHKNIFASADNNIEEKSKAYYLKHHLKGKRVAMIGDGENDAEIIAASHFSMAVKSNASDPESQAQAGAVIDDGSLLPVLNAFAISKQTVSNIKQNLIFSLIYNTTAILIAGGVLVAIGFALNPAVGAALMVLQLSLILLNQYRIRRQHLEHIKRYEAEMQLIQANSKSFSSQQTMLKKMGLEKSSLASNNVANEAEKLSNNIYQNKLKNIVTKIVKYSYSLHGGKGVEIKGEDYGVFDIGSNIISAGADAALKIAYKFSKMNLTEDKMKKVAQLIFDQLKDRRSTHLGLFGIGRRDSSHVALYKDILHDLAGFYTEPEAPGVYAFACVPPRC